MNALPTLVQITTVIIYLLVVASVTAIPFMALIYSYVILYTPFPYSNFFITLGFRIGTG